MSFDYDLVVIGSTPEGMYAAKKAVLLKARVALVTQSTERYLDRNLLVNNFCLSEITKNQEFHCGKLPSQKKRDSKNTLQDIKNYSSLVRENIDTEDSLANLAILGVDVIEGKGEFCRSPKQAFLVSNRNLRSRNYLLATGAKYSIKTKYNISGQNCFTPDSLWQQEIANIPQNAIVIGASPRSIELAQRLARLGKNITLATAKKRLLERENVAVSRFLQAQLAADNIKLLLDTPLEQLKAIENKIWLQLGNMALETDAIILTNGREPNITGLNLEGIGIKSVRGAVVVNDRLQTTNKSVYACGDILGGNSLSHIAKHEVDISLKNILSFPWFKPHYHLLPRIVLTQPNIASIGLTSFDKIQNKNSIYCIEQNFKSNLIAQVTDNVRGWCQFIIQSNGKILGCTIICDRAVELINIVALMMRHKIKLNRNPIQGLLNQEIIHTDSSYSEIFDRITIAFHQQKILRDRRLRNNLENWFDWRKN